MIHRIARAHFWIAAALAAIVISTGLAWSTRVAAGADAYGYVSQADLWLRGNLHIDQSFGASVPWPLARWTFTPLGYRPEPVGYRIVPQYAAGLPLLMAAFKLIAGQCAMFWVVPICGGILVFATYTMPAGSRCDGTSATLRGSIGRWTGSRRTAITRISCSSLRRSANCGHDTDQEMRRHDSIGRRWCRSAAAR